MLQRPVLDGNIDRRLLWRRPVLDPGSKLLKETAWLAARSAEAMLEAGDLVVLVETVSVRQEGGHFFVVFLCRLEGEKGIRLDESIS